MHVIQLDQVENPLLSQCLWNSLDKGLSYVFYHVKLEHEVLESIMGCYSLRSEIYLSLRSVSLMQFEEIKRVCCILIRKLNFL